MTARLDLRTRAGRKLPMSIRFIIFIDLECFMVYKLLRSIPCLSTISLHVSRVLG
jgi:hypothetical protein